MIARHLIACRRSLPAREKNPDRDPMCQKLIEIKDKFGSSANLQAGDVIWIFRAATLSGANFAPQVEPRDGVFLGTQHDASIFRMAGGNMA